MRKEKALSIITLGENVEIERATQGYKEVSYDIGRGDKKGFWPGVNLPGLVELQDPSHPVHAYLMGVALEEARSALAEEEVPVGAIVVSWEQGVIARAHNQREQLQDPTAHAEMLAITQAAAARESWRLTDCALYVTLEPCPMCAGAIVQARLPLVVFGAFDPKAGACGSLYRIPQDPRLNHRAVIIGGVREEECAQLLRDFFRLRRGIAGTRNEDELA